MKVTASEIEDSQVVLEMEIEPERVEKAMDRAYRHVASHVNVPGFRRGKAPRVMVERVVGREALMNEALEILVPEVYEEALQETNTEPVGRPKLDIVSAEPLFVKATVPIRPKVELGDYKAVRQSLEEVEITDEQVTQTLENLREARATWVEVDRETKAGDLANLSIKARVEDRTFVDSKDINLILDPERAILAPGVVDEIIGMKAGDQKAFDATLPEDFSDKELAGQQAAIEVALSGVKEKNLPELDDELAKSMGEYATVDELKAAVRKQLEDQARVQARIKLEDSVIDTVVDLAQATPPPVWVEEQAESLRANTEERVKREGLTLEQFLRFSDRTEESFNQDMEDSARKQLKRTLVLDAVADTEEIEVTDNELNVAFDEAMASRRGRREEPVDADRVRSNLRTLLRERKTIDRLVEIATDGAVKPESAEKAEEQTAASEAVEEAPAAE